MLLKKKYSNINDIYSQEKGDCIYNETIPTIDSIYKNPAFKIHPKKLSIYTIFNAAGTILEQFPDIKLEGKDNTKKIKLGLEKAWDAIYNKDFKEGPHDTIWESQNPYQYQTKNEAECMVIFSTMYYHMIFDYYSYRKTTIKTIEDFLNEKKDNAIFAKFKASAIEVMTINGLDPNKKGLMLTDGSCNPVIKRGIIPDYIGIESILKDIDSYGEEVISNKNDSYNGRRIKASQLYELIYTLHTLLKKENDTEINYKDIHELCGWIGDFNPESVKKAVNNKNKQSQKDTEELIEKTKNVFPSLEKALQKKRK